MNRQISVLAGKPESEKLIRFFIIFLCLYDRKNQKFLSENFRMTTVDKDPAILSNSGMMTIKEKKLAELPGQKQVFRYDLKNSRGTSVAVTNYGATLMGVRTADKKGRFDDIVLGFDTLDGYLKDHPFFGCSVGRFANRIGNATFSIDKKTYRLIPNEGKNQLHGGPGGFHKAIFAPSVEQTRKEVAVLFTHFSPDLDQGFPGNLMVQIRYSLNEKNELKITYRAISDKKTPVNLTNHAYWNLSGKAEVCQKAHMININADALVEVDDEKIPTGNLLDIRGTEWDLRRARVLSDILKSTGGVDHCYVIKGHGLRHAARVSDTVSGRTMDVFTDQYGVQFYTGNFLNHRVRGAKTFGKQQAFCLETQNFPDAPNHPDFPDCILAPGGEYTHTVVHRFSVR
jgi:aldose 1-epimerase